MDAVQSYHQISVCPEDCYKTAFVTDENQWEFVYMPFGAKTASQTYAYDGQIASCSQGVYLRIY